MENFLLENEAKNVCKEYGIPITTFRTAKSLEEAIKFSEEIGYPTVFKIGSPNVIHKLNVGGVILNINSLEEAKKAYNLILGNPQKHILDAIIDGVLIQ